MRPYIALAACLIATNATVALGQTCEVASKVPSDNKKLGSGSATVHYDGVTTVKGGQAVYVKIKNANVLGVSYVLTIEEGGKPPAATCSYKAVLPPQTTVILSEALFADPPIFWKITVAIGDESDAGVLTYEVYSMPQATNSKNVSSQGTVRRSGP